MDWMTASLHAGTEESRSRSDVLKTLVWPFGLSLAATAGAGVAVGFGAPTWVPAVPATMTVMFGVIYALGFAFFAIKNPDELRSENFTLRKMAIEKGLLGDSTVGLTPIADSTRVSALSLDDQTDADRD